MSYIPHTDDDLSDMLQSIGVDSIEELFADVPPALRLQRSLDLPQGGSELELLRLLREYGGKNMVCQTSFLGAGAYRHFVPSAVDYLISRGEFFTAYTPYQPEVSQGTLQAIFEFQSMMCNLTGMDVTNASTYDGGCAAVDAVLMALNITKRSRVLVSRGIHPQVRQLLRTYLSAREIVLEELPLQDGGTVKTCKGDDVACILFGQPNFFGCIEDTWALCELAHGMGALSIVMVGDPVSLGMLKAPGDCGADIVCGDAQALGIPVSFGGPYVGYVACRKKFLRRLPGRLCGMTVDASGRRAYCLTLQAREQHIRREKAASNICTNQGLCALAVTVYLSLMGPQGLREVAQVCYDGARYFRDKVSGLPGYSLVFDRPVFHEVLLRCPVEPEVISRRLVEDYGIEGGFGVGKEYPEYGDCMLFCFTEMVSKFDIERLCCALSEIAGGGDACKPVPGNEIPLSRGGKV